MDNISINRYKDFEEPDLICDPYFQDWVISPNEENERFWKGFLEIYPAKAASINYSRSFLQNLRYETSLPDDEHIRRRFLEHLQAIEGSAPVRVIRLNRSPLKRIASIAAVVAGLALMVVVFFLLNSKSGKSLSSIVATDYGEMKELTLPDSTHIVLNAHSQISFKKRWTAGEPREVWLEGEAFFDVKHLNKQPDNIRPDERFLVHGKDLTIEVLGTAFNIRQRRGKTEVVLQSGKIRLLLKNEEIVMQPGDWVVYDSLERRVIRSITIPENYAAWKEKKLLLNDPTVEQIIEYLEDVYGKHIVLDNPALKNKKIEGPIMLNNLDDALFVISTVLNTRIEHRNDTLILHQN